jgi:predicted RNase H-like nuclease (RuvC/YqgF family)
MFENMVSNLEERVAKIEGILEQMDKRLNHLESEVRDLRNELYREIRDLRKALDYRFYWLLGVQISMWVTIILTIMFK